MNFGSLSGGGTGDRTFPAFQTVGVSGTFTPGTNGYTVTSSTIDFNGTSAQSIPAFTYNNLTVTSASVVTKTLTGVITVNDDLTINANNTLDDAGYQITGNASGTLTITAGASLSIGNASTATAFPTNYINSNISLNASSTVVYNSDQAQTISLIPTYGNLTLTSAAPVTKTINGTATVQTTVTVNVNNILSITGSGVLNINNGDLELFGNISNSGTINIGL